MFKIGTFAVIFDTQGKVLLCHRTDFDAWNLPGGGVEQGELPTEGVIREVHEETGLVVEIEQLIGVYGKGPSSHSSHSLKVKSEGSEDRASDTGASGTEAVKDELVFTFICRFIGGRLTVTAESRECRFFAINDLPANTLSHHIERIHDALRFNHVPNLSPVFRRQSALLSQGQS